MQRDWVVEEGGLYGCFREQLASRSDFTGDVLNISAGSLFQNGTARMLKAYCRQRLKKCLLVELIGVAV